MGAILIESWEWLPPISDARTLLSTLLAAQAAITALTLAVTLFVMQVVNTKRDIDDRMYREYVRQSSVQPIFWGSIGAVVITALIFLAYEIAGNAEIPHGIASGIQKLSLVAILSFLVNLLLTGALFQRSLWLAHPERWNALRRNVNERDVRESVKAFLARQHRAIVAGQNSELDFSLLFPDQDEGSADEAIRAFLDDARRAMVETRLREFKQSLEAIQDLIAYAMDEMEREGIAWDAPGGQPEWPPLRELGRNLYSFREDVIQGGQRDYVFELLRFDCWLTITGWRRRCGGLFTVGLDGYIRNYELSVSSKTKDLHDILRDRVCMNARFLFSDSEPKDVLPYALEMLRCIERMLSDAMHSQLPEDYEKLHKGFEGFLRAIRQDWEYHHRSIEEINILYSRLEQNYQVALMALSGRAIDRTEIGKSITPEKYLNIGRGIYGRSDHLSDGIIWALSHNDGVATLWTEWEWERSEPGLPPTLYPDNYPLIFFVVRLIELSSDAMPPLDLGGDAERILNWFKANSERLRDYVNLESPVLEEHLDSAESVLQDAVKQDEANEDYQIISSELSPNRLSNFKSSLYAAAFANEPIEPLFERSNAFLYLPLEGADIPEKRVIYQLDHKGLLAGLPDVPTYYHQLEGEPYGRGLATDVMRIFCKSLDQSPEIKVVLDTPGELISAFDMAKEQLNPSSQIVVVLAGDWGQMESYLDSEMPDGYLPDWQLPDADIVVQWGQYQGHTFLRGPTDGVRRLYLVEPNTWGCFVRSQCEGDQDLRIDVNTISAERAREILNENPNQSASEPDVATRLRKLQTRVELEIYARIEFRVKDPSRARRVVSAASGLE